MNSLRFLRFRWFWSHPTFSPSTTISFSICNTGDTVYYFLSHNIFDEPWLHKKKKEKKTSGQENDTHKFYWERPAKPIGIGLRAKCLYFVSLPMICIYNAHFSVRQCRLYFVPFGWSVNFVAAYLQNERNWINIFFFSLKWSIIKKANIEHVMRIRLYDSESYKWRDANEINTIIYYSHKRFTTMKLNSQWNCQQQQPDSKKCDGKKISWRLSISLMCVNADFMFTAFYLVDYMNIDFRALMGILPQKKTHSHTTSSFELFIQAIQITLCWTDSVSL